MDAWKDSWTYIKRYDKKTWGLMITMIKTKTLTSRPKKKVYALKLMKEKE